MICVKFSAFCDLRADLRIRLATYRKGPDTRCNVACNIARNVAGVEASSTSATFHATIAPCVHPIARNVARNVASCVRSLSPYASSGFANLRWLASTCKSVWPGLNWVRCCCCCCCCCCFHRLNLDQDEDWKSTSNLLDSSFVVGIYMIVGNTVKGERGSTKIRGLHLSVWDWLLLKVIVLVIQ